MKFLIVLGILFLVGSGTDAPSLAAEHSAGPTGEPTAASEGKPREPQGKVLGRLESRFYGATPEEHARLEAERTRLSAAAAGFGTDPTAIVGFYQLNYGHTAFTNNLRVDSATATVRLPITPNLLFTVNMPYAWADLNDSSKFPLRGASDMTTRTGGRVFANEDVAVFVGLDTSFPTASEKQLGTGKYTLGPGGALAVPLPRMRSLFFLLALDYNSIGGDPSRANIHFTQVQSVVNTIWSERWWSQAIMTWDVDWNNRRKTTMNLLGEVGYRFDNHWNVYAGPGMGVIGKETFLGLDWTVQAGVRWVFTTPLIPERRLESFPRK